MPKVITINNITGSSPYNIYLCENSTGGECVWLNTITTLPQSITIPLPFVNLTTYTLKVEDSNGCIKYTELE